MAQTMLIVDIAIKPGKAEDFRAAAQALFERTQDEPGTLRYEYYIADDETRNINIEVFEDAAAFVAHNQHCAPLVPALLAAGDIRRIDVVGDHSDELYAELEGMDLLHFTRLGGISR
jgi:quinol monooxygenase YgiN